MNAVLVAAEGGVQTINLNPNPFNLQWERYGYFWNDAPWKYKYASGMILKNDMDWEPVLF